MVVTDYELRPQNFDFFPLDWSKIFGRTSKLIVEIGFGNGEFLAEMARKYPEKNFVGFEVSITSFVKAQKKFKRYGLRNVKLVKVDGRFGLRELFPNNSVEKVYVNFPCPWPKKKHENRRITSHDFIQTLSAVLEMNGTLELATDEEWYAREVFDKFKETEYFVVDSFLKNFRREVETRYERKWKAQGKKNFLIIVRKVKHGTVRRLLEGKSAMAHTTFVGTVTWERLKNLEGKVYKEKSKVFVVKKVYRDDDFLLKIISTDEGDFQQVYYLNLSERNGKWILKLDDGSDPYRTPALKWSLRKIAEELSI
ncbi:tRNA (guanosine(46)-N7)-methyltransferase TrmB [Thermotoga sp. KOL6]|uniref:tRNA (guanosine(46)-N7)-methyltransferase TrmB n=1 Tax=Thermotoga sp. KOL6 TaxID=126741 RepID=UPI000C76F0C1|nr:tRNA (guanosine(46)-N7)-methyltransferase TrmB [Thermotoga sp. KOL6]PLV59729.1 tRNA (guanine-N7)-methyltransferase [Thermotoga sp. KOL6]